MPILNISTKTKLIVMKVASILSGKTIIQSHSIGLICITLFINFFPFDSQAKAVFDVMFKEHNSKKKANLGIVVMDDNTETFIYENSVSKTTTQVSSTSTTDNRRLVYINGMRTDLSKAISNLLVVTNTMATVVASSNVQLAYNANERTMTQIAEVAAQHFKQKNNLTEKQAWFKFAYQFLLPLRYNVFENAEEYMANLGEADYVDDFDLNKHINSIYLPLLKDKKEVVLLAHSQGNFYANRAWDIISQMPNGDELTGALGIVGIANPANHVSGSLSGTELYTTSHNDKVISKIRFWLPIAPLPSNIEIPETPLDDLGHALEDVYLKNNASRIKIVTDVNEMFDRLIPKATCTGFSKKSTHGGGGLITFYTPGENFIGTMNFYFNAYDSNARNQLIIKGVNSSLPLLDTSIVTGQRSGSFYYDWSRDGELLISIINSDSKVFDEWDIDITCPN